MALIGTTDEEKIWNYLKAQDLTSCGVAGLMGNLYAESGLRSDNLQNVYEGKLGMADAEYTELVDKGSYTNFIQDNAGYGLAQWTHSTRKAALLAYVKAAGASVGDLETQLGFLMQELSTNFKTVLSALKTATTVRVASDVVLTEFEKPADQSETTKQTRATYGQIYYSKYVKGSTDIMNYTNSSLASVTLISPNKNSPRNHAIDTISVHCFVGQVTAQRGCEAFQSTSKQASCNYVVGHNGDIGLCVEEKDRSWCTSSASNDHRAVTIEVASDTTSPYAVTDKAYAALLDLLTDICKRNGKSKLVWLGDKDKSLAYTPAADEMLMTVHRWFANKACPGEYLYSRHAAIATEVTKRLGGSAVTATSTTAATSSAAQKKAADSAQSFDKTLAGTYTVTAGSGLHIRNGAATSKTSMAVLPNGTKVQNYGYYTLSGGVKWLYVQTTHNGIVYIGFMNSQYLSKQ